VKARQVLSFQEDSPMAKKMDKKKDKKKDDKK
jgi:hypothetical protein